MERLIVFLVALMAYVALGVDGTNIWPVSHAQVNITRDGCGTSKLCVETPDDCDPTGNNACLFVSVASKTSNNYNNLTFELRGISTGYIAVGLNMTGSEDIIVFVCARNSSNSGALFLATRKMTNSNTTLVSKHQSVTDIQGLVTGDVIRCEFTSLNMTRSSNDSRILLGSGTVTGNTIGDFRVNKTSVALNISDPTSNTPPPTGSGSSTVQPHALLLLLLLSVSSLSTLLRA